MPKRRPAAAPASSPRRKMPRDRKRLYIALLALLIVASMLLSGMAALFYGSG